MFVLKGYILRSSVPARWRVDLYGSNGYIAWSIL